MIALFKKVLFLVLALPILCFAKEDINIIWGFSPSSGQATVLRIMIDDLNKTQSKYNFLFVNKQGAGGTIAANTVTASPNSTVVGMSSSFFIRPYYESSNVVHNLNDFKPIIVQSLGSPLVFVSSKYSSMDQIDRNEKLSIGVSGLGTVSHLAANEFSKLFPNSITVNFKSMIDASVAAAGGHVDVAVMNYGDVAPLLSAQKINVLSFTGSKNLFNLKNKKLSSLGVKDGEFLTVNYAIFASNNMDAERYTEIQQLLLNAHKKQNIVSLHESEMLSHVVYSDKENSTWYEKQKVFWKSKVDEVIKR